jgi:hypothetical protein
MKFFKDQVTTDIVNVIKAQPTWGRKKLRDAMGLRLSQFTDSVVLGMKPVDKTELVLTLVYSNYIKAVDNRSRISNVHGHLDFISTMITNAGTTFNIAKLREVLREINASVKGESDTTRRVIRNASIYLVKHYVDGNIGTAGRNECNMLMLEYITYEVSKVYYSVATVKPDTVPVAQ